MLNARLVGESMAVFILEDALSVWTNLGKHSLFVRLCVSGIKTGTRRIMRQDELSFIVRLERRTTENSSSRRIMRLVPVFILDTNNQTNNKAHVAHVDVISSFHQFNVICAVRAELRNIDSMKTDFGAFQPLSIRYVLPFLFQKEYKVSLSLVFLRL